MNNLEVYSPLQDLSMCCGEYTELVYAINRSLELAQNEEMCYGKVRKSISIKRLVEDNKRMKQYESNSNIVWNEFEVASAFYRYFDIIKKLYELQGWKVSTQCSVSDDFGSSPEDEIIFEF